MIRSLLWRTRYGTYEDFPLVARFFDAIDPDEVPVFNELLLRLLTPPSLYYAKSVYPVHGKMHEIAGKLTEKGNGVALLRQTLQDWRLDGKKLVELLSTATDFEIAWRPSRKNLMCPLVEVLKHGASQTAEWNGEYFRALFVDWTEVEHVQCYTDEKDRDAVWNDWGGELNKIGNLAILEGTLNRSIRNHKEKKPEAYARSKFAAILEAKEAGCELIFTTGGMSVDPDDRTPLAIRNTGAEIVTYGAPVLPGAMFLVSYLDGVPVCGLPGCVMYAKRTIFDLLLPRLLADDPITAEDIARLGEGGLCLNCDVCHWPNCGFGHC